jgi:hypothetical protein
MPGGLAEDASSTTGGLGKQQQPFPGRQISLSTFRGTVFWPADCGCDQITFNSFHCFQQQETGNKEIDFDS